MWLWTLPNIIMIRLAKIYLLVQYWQKWYGIINQLLVEFKSLWTRYNSYLTPLLVLRTCSETAILCPREELNTIPAIGEHRIKSTVNEQWLYQLIGVNLTSQKKYLYCRSWLTERTIIGQWTKIKAWLSKSLLRHLHHKLFFQASASILE